MYTNPAQYTSAGVNIVHTAPHNMAGPTANPRVAFPSPYIASAPRAGFTYPQGYGPMGYGTPYGAPQGIYPNATIGFPPRAAEPVSGAYQGAHAGPSPIRYVTVTRATGIGAALAAGATIVFATPSTPARVIYPNQQTAAPTSGADIIRPTPRYGVPMPGTKIVPPRQNGPPPTFTGKAFHPVARATVQTSMAQGNQAIPSIWNTVTSPDSGMKTPSASPPSSVWDVSSPDTVSASSTSGVHILSQLRVGSPLTSDDTVAPALNVGDVVLASKEATPSSCVSNFLQQMSSVRLALVTSSLVVLSRPYIPYIRVIKEGRRSCRDVIMRPVEDVMSIHRELKHPYVTCDRMRKRGEKLARLSQHFNNTQRLYVHPVQMAAPYTPPYPAHVQRIYYVVPSVYMASQTAQRNTPASVAAPASYSEVCYERSSHATGITGNNRPSMQITTRSSKRKTTMSTKIVAAPASDATSSGHTTYGIWSVTTTVETKIATATQEVAQDVMLPPCALPAPQASISSSTETSLLTSEATLNKRQIGRFSPITSAWCESPVITSAISDDRPTSVSPPSSPWERNASPNESPTTSDIHIRRHLRAGPLLSQEDSAQCLTKCTTQAADEQLNPVVKRRDSITEFKVQRIETAIHCCEDLQKKIDHQLNEYKEEKANVSKEECDRKALEAIQLDPDCTNPVQSVAETLETIQVDAEHTKNVHDEEKNMEANKLDAGSTKHVHSEEESLEANKLDTERTKHVHSEEESLEANKLDAGSTKHVHSEEESLEAKKLDTERTRHVHSEEESLETNKIDAEITKHVHSEEESLEANKLDTERTKHVHSEEESLEASKLDAGSTKHVHSEEESLEANKLDAGSTKHVHSDEESLEANKLDTERTKHVHSEEESLEASKLDAGSTKHVHSEEESLEANKLDTERTRHVHSEEESLEANKIDAESTKHVHSDEESLEANKLDTERTKHVHSEEESLEASKLDAGSTKHVHSEEESLEASKLDAGSTKHVHSEEESLEASKLDAGSTKHVHSEEESLEASKLDAGSTKHVHSEEESLEASKLDAGSTKHVHSEEESLEASKLDAGSTKHVHSEEESLEASKLDAGSTKHVHSEEESLEASKLDAESTNHEQHEESLEINQPNADGANAAARENPAEPVQDADQVQVEQIVPVIHNEHNDIPAGGEREDNETGPVSLEEHRAYFNYPSLLISFFFGRD